MSELSGAPAASRFSRVPIAKNFGESHPHPHKTRSPEEGLMQSEEGEELEGPAWEDSRY